MPWVQSMEHKRFWASGLLSEHLSNGLKGKQKSQEKEPSLVQKFQEKKQKDHNVYKILKAILLRIKGNTPSSIFMGNSTDR